VAEGFYREYLASEHWYRKRAAALRAAGYMCSRCGTVGAKRGSGLQVHHLTYARLGDELLEDLRVLCQSCHNAIHDKPRSKRLRKRIKAANAEMDWLRRMRAKTTDLIEENKRLHLLQSRRRRSS